MYVDVEPSGKLPFTDSGFNSGFKFSELEMSGLNFLLAVQEIYEHSLVTFLQNSSFQSSSSRSSFPSARKRSIGPWVF